MKIVRNAFSRIKLTLGELKEVFKIDHSALMETEVAVYRTVSSMKSRLDSFKEAC